MFQTPRLKGGSRTLLKTLAAVLFTGVAGLVPAIAQDAAQPVSGGTLTIGLSGDPLGVDGAVSTGIWRSITRALSDSLVFLNPATKQIDPWLAKEWTVSDDARIYKFILRDDVTFNDGTKLTADVVKANLESLQRPGIHSSSRTVVQDIKETRILGDYELEVEFNHPNAAFLPALTGARLGIVSKKTAESGVEERQYFLDGSGPFKQVNYVDGSEVVLERRDDYNWAPAYFDHEGPAYLDGITYRVILEDSVRLGALQSGEIQFAASIKPIFIPQLEAAGLKVFTEARNPGTGTETPLNTSSPILSDIKVRQALQVGTDREEISQVTSRGYDLPAQSVLSPANPAFKDFSELLKYDPNKATALLDEAGWTETGADGIRVKDGKRLSLRFPRDSAVEEVLQNQWKKLGIELVLDPPLAAEANAALLSGEYDLGYWYHSLPDPDVLRQNYGVATGSNRAFIKEPGELDALLQQQNASSDKAERQVVVDKAVEILLRDAYTLPLVHDLDVWAYAPNLTGLHNSGVDQLLYDAWFVPN